MAKATASFNYVLKRTEAVLDSGNVVSTATANIDNFEVSVTGCSITSQQLYLSSDTSVVYSGADVVIQSSSDAANAYLAINRATHFTKDFILKGLAPTSKTQDINLKIIICGEETISEVAGTTQIIVNKFDSVATGPVFTAQTDLAAYFTTSVSTFCGGLTFGLTDSAGIAAIPYSDSGVELSTLAPPGLNNDKAKPINKLYTLTATTKGQISATKKLVISSCVDLPTAISWGGCGGNPNIADKDDWSTGFTVYSCNEKCKTLSYCTTILFNYADGNCKTFADGCTEYLDGPAK